MRRVVGRCTLPFGQAAVVLHHRAVSAGVGPTVGAPTVPSLNAAVRFNADRVLMAPIRVCGGPSSQNDLVYVPGRQIDDDLSWFLQGDGEYNMVASLFCPPRTGKTTSVHHAAAAHGFTLRCFFNGKLSALVDLMTAEGRGNYASFRSATRHIITLHLLGIADASERVLIHLDEAQQFLEGLGTFRDVDFDFQRPPVAAQLAALVYHVRMLCRSNRRCVVSGTAVNAAPVLAIASHDKMTRLHIMPTNIEFVKNVLIQQQPPLRVMDDQAAMLCGHVGQLYWVHRTRTAAGEPDLDAAFNEWFQECQDRLRWTITDAMNVSLLFSKLPKPKDGVIAVSHGVKTMNTFKELMADGAWATVLIIDRWPVIVPLFPWQEKALNQLYANAQTLVTHAFVTQSAAAVNDPMKQKGLVFQLMVALELGRMASPLWALLGVDPVPFQAYERFAADPVMWEPNTLYVVKESPQRKLADIVFRAGSQTVALELKCGGANYVTNAFRRYNDHLSRGADVKHVFMSCDDVPFLRDPTSGRKSDGTLNARCPVRCVIVNDARSCPTEFVLHPEFSGMIPEFSTYVTRTAEAAAIVEAVTRKGFDVGGAAFYVRVQLPGAADAVTTDVAATLRKEDLPRTVDGLKEAVLKKFEKDPDFQGKSVRHLRVYPPGKEKGAAPLGDLDDIQATPRKDEPYHVVVA